MTGEAGVLAMPGETAQAGPTQLTLLAAAQIRGLIIDGVLQNQDGVTSVRAEQVHGMRGVDLDFDAHDFY